MLKRGYGWIDIFVDNYRYLMIFIGKWIYDVLSIQFMYRYTILCILYLRRLTWWFSGESFHTL